MSKLYTVKQASKILGFSTNTVYKYINDGSLKASRASSNKGRFRITKNALEDFLGGQLPAENQITSPSSQTGLRPIEKSSKEVTRPGFSLKTSRVLILFGLILLIIEAFSAPNVPLTSQLLRLVSLMIFFLLAYQFVYPAKSWRDRQSNR